MNALHTLSVPLLLLRLGLSHDITAALKQMYPADVVDDAHARQNRVTVASAMTENNVTDSKPSLVPRCNQCRFFLLFLFRALAMVVPFRRARVPLLTPAESVT